VMGQGQSSQHHGDSQQRQMNWLEFVKLTCVTLALGAVQFARYKLAAADEDDRTGRLRGWRSPRRSEQQHADVFHALPRDARHSLITFIDCSVTPLLIDQWRCGPALEGAEESVLLSLCYRVVLRIVVAQERKLPCCYKARLKQALAQAQACGCYAPRRRAAPRGRPGAAPRAAGQPEGL